MALYIPHSIFHLARLLYVRLETFAPYYVFPLLEAANVSFVIIKSLFFYVPCLIYVLRVFRICRYCFKGFRMCEYEICYKRMELCIESCL
jgi:hypothetical protein